MSIMQQILFLIANTKKYYNTYTIHMYKLKTPDKLVIPPPNLIIDETGSAIGSFTSLTAKKRIKNNAFVTQVSKRLTSQQLVNQSHQQLLNYIDVLQTKVQSIIQSHDSQFLLAYRNHLNRVREQMQELKNKNANDANSVTNQTQKIEVLQKQLIIFREQALRLFDKMTEKDKQIQLLKMKIYELETEKKFNHRTMQDLMKRNKYLEAMVKEFNLERIRQKSIDNQKDQEKKKSMSFMQVNSLRKYSSNQKRALKNLGWTEHSFFNSNNTTKMQSSQNKQVDKSNIEYEKQSRPTTTALGSKRNTISMSNTNRNKSMGGYFARNIAKNVDQHMN